MNAVNCECDTFRLVLRAVKATEVIRLAQYANAGLTGTFANLPDGAVTNFGGRGWQIHYDVELPGENPSTRFITLAAPVVVPRFTSIQRLAGGDVLLRGSAGAGATVSIEGSENLETFQFVGSTVANGAGQFTFLDSPGALAKRFYRALLPVP